MEAMSKNSRLKYSVCAISEWKKSDPTFENLSTHCCPSPKMETFPDHHDVSKMIKTVLTVALVSFLSICGCLPSGPRDMCMPFVYVFPISFTKNKFSLLWSFLLAPSVWDTGHKQLKEMKNSW